MAEDQDFMDGAPEPEQEEDTRTPGEIMAAYVAEHREIQRVRNELKALERDHAGNEGKIIEVIKATGLEAVTLVSGDTLTLKNGWKGSLIEADEETYAKLREYSWSEGLVKDYIHPSSLSSRVRETMEQQGKLPPEIEELVEATPTESVSVTRETQRSSSRSRRG